MKYLLIVSGFLMALTACHSRKNGRNFLFDMGTTRQPAEKGFVRITAADEYTASRGYGWIKAPEHSFDSVNGKLPPLTLHDGVSSPDTLRFRADVPNGDYFIRLYLGVPDPDTSSMLVSINGESFPDTITTPWFRIPYKTFCRKISVNDGSADISVAALSKRNAGIYGIELRAVTETKSIPFKSALDQDTAEVSAFAGSLQSKQEADTADIAVKNQLQNVTNYLRACYYFNGGGWSWAVKKTGLSLIYRLYAAADLLEPIIVDPSDPLYDRSLYLLAKIYYWLDQEDNSLYHTNKFNGYFAQLHTKYPDDSLIRMYLGEKIFDPPAFDTVAGNAPSWAVYQRETMHRMLKVINWWVNDKQIDNGEMGGKYGDDVELLRWWLPAILGADDSTAQKGYKRLADGVWNSDALERGFAKRIDDVEHSAELFRDTHPSMFLMNYGDPEYVERCLVSMQNFRDVWTGITPLGHLHFKSYYLSATEALTKPPFGIDVALNARAILPGLWATWYNHNPSLVKLFSAYGNAWVADAARSDNGKPAGLIPSAVSFAQDRIGGDSPDWYDAHLTYDYYQWDHVGHVGELQNHLIGMYGITHNPNFLKPVNTYASLIEQAQGEKEKLKSGKPGSFEWAKLLLLNGGIDFDSTDNPVGKSFSFARRVTRSTRYDSLIAKYGAAYDRYQVTHDTRVIQSGFEEILSGLRYNFPLLTSEVKFTDRVYMPGSDLVMGMYTGHFGAGYEYPSLVATWKNTGPDVSIFVRQGDERSATISLYNFGAAKRVQMRTWMLEPGTYQVVQGTDTNDDGIIDAQNSIQEIEVKERVNTVELEIPSKQEIAISIRQLASHGSALVDVPDPGLSRNDIQVTGSGDSTRIRCRIHNIGNKTATGVVVNCAVDGKEIGHAVISSIEAPLDLKPRWKEVFFNWKPGAGPHRIRVTIVYPRAEITKLNNEAELLFIQP